MRVCLRRPLHSTLLFSSSFSTTRTSTTSPNIRLGRVWSQRSLSNPSASASAITLRSFKLPTPPGHTKIQSWMMGPKNMFNEICVSGQHNHLLCPKCKGGDSEEKSLSLHVTEDGGAALWMCFRGKCGWSGRTRAFADGRSLSGSLNPNTKVNIKREIAVESLQLEPLCDQNGLEGLPKKVSPLGEGSRSNAIDLPPVSAFESPKLNIAGKLQ